MNFFLFFVLGAIFGSFANVLVDRSQKHKSLLGRSKCDFCHYKLRWFDNIPIISFLLIGGRCRKCRKKLSWQYPLVELATGLIFVLMAWQAQSQWGNSQIGFWQTLVGNGFDFGLIISILFYLIIGFLFVAIFLWDLKYLIIPDGLVLIGLGATFFYYLYRYFNSACSLFDYNCYLTENLIGAILVGGFFYLMYAFSKGKWIGGGDVKLGFWLGFLVGWQQVYFFLLIAYILGAMVAVGMLATGRKKLESQIPFGPFLLIGALIMFLWGQQITFWWKFIISYLY